MTNREHCKYIADRAEAYAMGKMWICPECGEHVEEDAGACACGQAFDSEEWEQASLYDYFANILDIDFVISKDKAYKACRIMVAFGGPTIYIDTSTRNVELYWWNEQASYPLDSYTLDDIDAWAEEYYSCL